MKIYVKEKEIIIPDDKKEIGKGSEGIVYRIGNTTYKIYYKNALEDYFGKKKKYHEYLMTLNTKQIILPTESIYDEFGEYIGYTAQYVKGNKVNKTGLGSLKKEDIIKNLDILEEDIRNLSKKFVIMADVKPYNYMFDKKEKKMTIIDPGRYKSFALTTREDNLTQNNQQFQELIFELIREDISSNKTINTKRKQFELAKLLKQQFEDSKTTLTDFFDFVLKDNETILDYAEKQKRYIK